MTYSKLVNAVSLLGLHGSNALVGLIAAPIALTRLGAEEYSRIAVTEALTLFGVTAVIYSFDVVGVKKVVEASDDLRALSVLLRDVTIAKLCLFIVVVQFTVIGYLCIAPDMLNYGLTWLLLPLSYALQPNWFFLGLEKNLKLAIITLTGRLLLVILIIQNLNSSSSGLTFILTYGGCFLLTASVSLAFALHEYPLASLSVSYRSVRSLLIEGFDVFLSAFCVGLFRSSNIVILAIFGVESSIISIYTILEKFVKSVQVACRPLNQLFTPAAFRELSNFREPDFNSFKILVKFVKWQIFLLASIWIVFFVIVYFVSFETHLGIEPSLASGQFATALSVMSIATLFGVANYMYGTIALNALGCGRYLFYAIAITGIFTIFVSSLLIHMSPFFGAILGYVFGEALLFSVLMAIFVSGRVRA